MLVATYGSLRKGHYNFKSFKRRYENITYLDTIEIKGWELFSFGSYPGAIFTDEDDTMIVDILDVSEDCKSAMDRMELGAGYKISKITWNNEEVDIYEYKNKSIKMDCLKVESGDWSDFKLNNNEKKFIKV